MKIAVLAVACDNNLDSFFLRVDAFSLPEIIDNNNQSYAFTERFLIKYVRSFVVCYFSIKGEQKGALSNLRADGITRFIVSINEM